MPKYDYIFTVFTPTYNRVHTLYRVYESLQKQTFKSFEWLIIDDGSTDNTEEIVLGWIQKKEFRIRYYKQVNKGKHFAIEYGVKKAKGELFLTLDSDDSCKENALERFNYHWQSIPIEKRVFFSAVTVLCLKENGEPFSEEKFPNDITISDSLEMYYKFKFRTEAWGFQRTEIMRKFKFNTEIQKSYIPEGIIWSQIARKYKTLFVNEYLRVYYVGHESITNNTNSFYNKIPGAIYWNTYNLNNNIDYFKYSPFSFYKNAISLVKFLLCENQSIFKYIFKLNNTLSKLLFILSIPLGFILYLKEKIKTLI